MIQVRILVCENSWIIEMHGATVKVIMKKVYHTERDGKLSVDGK
jgi:hypothetical protein